MTKPIMLDFSDDVKEAFEAKCQTCGWTTEEMLFIFMDGVNNGAFDLTDIVVTAGRQTEYEIKHI